MKRQVVKLLSLILIAVSFQSSILALNAGSIFVDVPSEAYYSAAVKWATENNITQGTTATTFEPTKTCTIANVITFLWRAGGSYKPVIQNPFSDVKTGAYYYNAALWSYQRGLTKPPSFEGSSPCTRADAVFFLWKIAGSPKQGSNIFSDVTSSSNYANAVAWAFETGITTGTSETTFSPDNVCTRAQVITFMYRFSQLSGKSFDAPVSVFSPLGERMWAYLQKERINDLIDRDNYGYMKAVANYQTDLTFLRLLNLADRLIDTGTKPDKKMYITILTNLVGLYELDNAAEISAQKERDNLKNFYDYGMDLISISANLVGMLESNSDLETELKAAIDGVSVLISNTDSWISEISTLETLMQDYSSHDEFLALIENNSDGDLKEAAIAVRTGLKESLKIRLDAYKNVEEATREDLRDYIFSDYIFGEDSFKALRETQMYANNEALRSFVDGGEKFIDALSAWETGKEIGKLIGNLVIGGEDLINRVMEMMALYDVSVILQSELLNTILPEFYETGSEDAVTSFVSLSDYLVMARMRGEYCLYNTAAVDGGILTWFQGQYGEEAKAWYESKVSRLVEIKKKIDAILIVPDDTSVINSYGIHYYEVFDLHSSSWDEAQNYCSSIGGHLATLTSKEENDHVFQIVSAAGYQSAYFGLSDRDNEGSWTWVTGEPVIYLNWHSGEPNSENSNEDYAMFYYKYPDGTWNDGDFGGRTVSGGTAFVCEWETESSYHEYLNSRQTDDSPFKQKYWVIFTEGFRHDRVEVSTIDSSLPKEQLYIIWSSSMNLNNTSASNGCDQYYLDENNDWIYMRTYGRLTDWATHVIASNLDVRDRSGNLLIPKCSYVDIDWDTINSYK